MQSKQLKEKYDILGLLKKKKSTFKVCQKITFLKAFYQRK